MVEFDFLTILLHLIASDEQAHALREEWRGDFYRELECSVEFGGLRPIRRMLFV